MKKKSLIINLLFVALWVFPFALLAQVAIPDSTGLDSNPGILPNAGLTDLLEYYNVLYGALVILAGYIAKAFGLKAKVPNFIIVIIAGGVVIAAGFLAMGFGKFFPLLFSFLGAIGFFEIFLKPIERATGFREKKSVKAAA